MKLVDANLLLYAIDTTAPRHKRARAWVETALSASETIGFTWLVLLAFLRLSTSARIFRTPLEPSDAFELIDGWLSRPNATVLHPTDRHASLLRDLLMPLGTAGNLTSDAHLAALSLEHGAELCSSDADYARFPGVRWQDPLA